MLPKEETYATKNLYFYQIKQHMTIDYQVTNYSQATTHSTVFDCIQLLIYWQSIALSTQLLRSKSRRRTLLGKKELLTNLTERKRPAAARCSRIYTTRINHAANTPHSNHNMQLTEPNTQTTKHKLTRNSKCT